MTMGRNVVELEGSLIFEGKAESGKAKIGNGQLNAGRVLAWHRTSASQHLKHEITERDAKGQKRTERDNIFSAFFLFQQ